MVEYLAVFMLICIGHQTPYSCESVRVTRSLLIQTLQIEGNM